MSHGRRPTAVRGGTRNSSPSFAPRRGLVRARLVVSSRRFDGATPVAAKTRFKPTFMVSGQTRPQTRFKPTSKPVLMWIWPNDMNVDKWAAICQQLCGKRQHKGWQTEDLSTFMSFL